MDLSNIPIGNGMTDVDLDNYSKIVKENDIPFCTQICDKWRKDEIIRNNFTYLEPSAADWIIDHGIKCVGIDTKDVFIDEEWTSKLK